MSSSLHLTYRRNAKAALKNIKIREDKNESIFERARQDFGFFCEYVADKPPAAHHREWNRHFVTEQDSSCLTRIAGPNIDLLAPRGPLHPDTLVATPQGWAYLKDIEVGDTVYGDDGLEAKVLETFDYEQTDIYKVLFSDGTSLICDDSHRFDARRVGTDPKGHYRKMTLQEIRTLVTTGTMGNWRTGVQRTVRLAEEGEKPWLDKKGYARYQVPVANAVEYAEADLPIHPYLLGVLLGDGGLSCNREINITTKDVDIIDFINTILPEDHIAVERSYETRKYSYKIQLKDLASAKIIDGRLGGYKKLLAKQIDELGLFGKKAYDKFIPRQYLTASIEQREWLLRGLMDTDGTRMKRNDKDGTTSGLGGLSFCSSSKQLFDDVTELVRSLGGMVLPGKPVYPFYYKDGEKVVSKYLSYRMGIRLPEGTKPFYCKRKAATYGGPASSRSNSGLVRSIVDIQYAGKSNVRCIAVDNKQQRFLIQDYVVSSNSSKSTCLGLFTAWAIGVHTMAKMPLQILYISYTVDIARAKSATIKNIIESKKYQEVFPKVRLLKNVASNEYWSIDHRFADIDITGDEQFTLCAAGLKGSVTSKRSHLCVIDDPIKGAGDIANPDIRKAMRENWNAVVAPTMFEGGRAICLGTRFRHDDIHATTFCPSNNWTQIVIPALRNNEETGEEESYWPEMWSVEYLKERKRQAPIAFSFQYMNQVIRQNELSLAPELLIKAEIATEFDALGIGVDLSAGTKDKNDYSVFVLGGRIGDKIHIIDYRRLRVMGNLEKLDALKELLNDWSIIGKDESGLYYPTYSTCDIWSEAVQYQASLEADFKRVCLNEDGLYNLIWHPVKGFRADKLARFRGIMGMFEDRKIIFNRYRTFDAMFEELTNFGVSSHDDCVDSLVWLVTGLMRKGNLQLDY